MIPLDQHDRALEAQSVPLDALNSRYEAMQPIDIIADALSCDWFARAAVVSSFGAEAVALLHLVAQVRPDIPVIFIDTGKLFGETLRYRDRLQHLLGLEDVRTFGPRMAHVKARDPHGLLNAEAPDECCGLRKVEVLQRAMVGLDAWINGRKRYQSQTRAEAPILERDEDGRMKLTPLARWTAQDVKAHIDRYKLPLHPLVKDGYLSIGCFPCTSKVAPGEDARAGRWRDTDKSECGIHVARKPKA